MFNEGIVQVKRELERLGTAGVGVLVGFDEGFVALRRIAWCRAFL